MMSRESCPNCRALMEYDESRADDGTLYEAWWRCACCDRYFLVHELIELITKEPNHGVLSKPNS